MISACIFDVEGVILEPGRLPDWSVSEEDMLKAMQELVPDDLRDGVFIFIKELKTRGLNLAAVSCYPHLRTGLNRLQIRHYFHAFSEKAYPSPQLEMYIEACGQMSVLPDNTIVFTSSSAGIQAATEAGCWVIGVGVGHELAEADLVLPSLERVRFFKIIAAIGEEEE